MVAMMEFALVVVVQLFCLIPDRSHVFLSSISKKGVSDMFGSPVHLERGVAHLCKVFEDGGPFVVRGEWFCLLARGEPWCLPFEFVS